MGTVDFEKVKKLAEQAGAKKWAIQKWRQRGIPISWQIKLMKLEPGVFSFQQFESFNRQSSQPKNITT